VQKVEPTSIISSTASIINNNRHRIAMMNKQTTADNITYSPGGNETVIIDE
jgi:hypothetical protein